MKWQNFILYNSKFYVLKSQYKSMTKYDHDVILEKRSTHYLPVMPLLEHKAPEANYVQYF